MKGLGVVLGKDVVLGVGVELWNFVVVGDRSRVGAGSKVGSFCDIGKDVSIGENCNLQSHVTVSNGCKIGDHVFIGPNTSLLNDKYVRDESVIEPVVVEDYVKIGGGCVVLPRVVVGCHSFIGAGARVTRDVPAYSTVFTKAKRMIKRE